MGAQRRIRRYRRMEVRCGPDCRHRRGDHMTRPGRPEVSTRGRLPVGRRDRRPALAALALLLVVAGALGAALVVYRSGHRTDVLVAAHEIRTGERVTADDFAVARVAADSDLVVPASERAAFVGSFATTTIPAGALI